MVIGASNHYGELKEALNAGLPYLAGAVCVGFLLVALAVMPAGARLGHVHERLSHRRLEIALAGVVIPLGTFAAFLVVYWAL